MAPEVAELPIVRVCAWCRCHLGGPRLTIADGIEYVVSHGICGPCAASVAAETGLPCDDCGTRETSATGTLTVSGARWVCGACADRRGRARTGEGVTRWTGARATETGFIQRRV